MTCCTLSMSHSEGRNCLVNDEVSSGGETVLCRLACVQTCWESCGKVGLSQLEFVNWPAGGLHNYIKCCGNVKINTDMKII